MRRNLLQLETEFGMAMIYAGVNIGQGADGTHPALRSGLALWLYDNRLSIAFVKIELQLVIGLHVIR